MNNIHITEHSKKRARERIGINKKTLLRLLPRIKQEGAPYTKTSGILREYLDRKAGDSGDADIILWGTYIFVLRKECIVTVLFTPRELLRLARVAIKKHCGFLMAPSNNNLRGCY